MRNKDLTFVAGAGLLVGLGVWLWWWSAYGATLSSIERLVRRLFPGVPQISTSHLAKLLNGTGRKPVLLDVRKHAEFEVGHLPGAHHIDPATPIASLHAEFPKDTQIVTYCAVGYRSSAFAKRLLDAGFADVQNLEGSIFRWANEDRPLERDGKPTDRIHPYSNYWGRLVKPERRTSLPIRQ